MTDQLETRVKQDLRHTTWRTTQNVHMEIFCAGPQDAEVLAKIAESIPDDERLLSFNKDCPMAFTEKDNERLYIYTCGVNIGSEPSVDHLDEIIGIGTVKWDAVVRVIYTPTYQHQQGSIIMSDSNPCVGKGENISNNVYMGATWIFPRFRRTRRYNHIFDHKFQTAKQIKRELEGQDDLWRPVIIEPFGSVPETGRGNVNKPRPSSEAVYHVAMKKGFKHLGISVERDMGPTLVYDPEGRLFELREDGKPVRVSEYRPQD